MANFDSDDRKAIYNYLAQQIKDELNFHFEKSPREIAKEIVARASGSRKPYKQPWFQTIHKIILDIAKDKKDVSIPNIDTLQHIHKGLFGYNLTDSDIGGLDDSLQGSVDIRLGGQCEKVRIYSDPQQTDVLMQTFVSLNSTPQPLLMAGFAFTRTLEQWKNYIPQYIARGYSFHFLVFNPFSSHLPELKENKDYLDGYVQLVSYHNSLDIEEMKESCRRGFKYFIEIMYDIAKLHTELQNKVVDNKSYATFSEKDKYSLGDTFSIKLYSYPLFYRGHFANLPKRKDTEVRTLDRYYLIAPAIMRYDRAMHPFHLYRARGEKESAALSPYIKSVQGEWEEAGFFDKTFSESLKLEELVRQEAGKQDVTKFGLQKQQSIFDFFEVKMPS